MTRGAVVGLALAAMAAPARARADTPTNQPGATEADRWAATATGWWAGLDDARVVGLGALAVGATASVIARPVELAVDGIDVVPVDHRATLTLAAAYGVTETIELQVAMPFVLQAGDRRMALGDVRELRGATLGDARLGAKVQLLAGARITAALAASLSLPTGNEVHYAGEASWIADWRGLAMARFGAVAVGVGAGVRLRGEEVALSPTAVSGNEVVGAIAVSVRLPPVAGAWCDWTELRAIAELDGVLGDTVGGERSPSPIEARLGVRGRLWRGWTVAAIGGAGVVDEVGAPAWRGVVEVSWRSEPRTDVPPPRRLDDADDELCDGDDC
jgi:hypothetical protein